jgi:hypothetical protein
VVAAPTSAVVSDSMAAVVAGLQPPPPGMTVVAPPPPGMGAVGGSGTVRARVAALNAATGAVGGAATGAVASRTFPLLARTTTVETATQTDDMVLCSCHSCSQGAGGRSKK